MTIMSDENTDELRVAGEPEAAVSGASAEAAGLLQRIRETVGAVFFGQAEVVDQVLAAFVSGGHVLLEGKPGLGKTHLVLALARTFGGVFRRIQFTPDLLPGDVTGHTLYDMGRQEFRLRKGPVFTNLLLADEINRAPAKTQAALLEVMQETQVTIDGETLPLPPPFMTLATQNPIEQEGTYALPEAQLDRFLMKVLVDYPEQADEERIVAAAPYGIPRLFLINTTYCDIPKRLQPFLPALYPLRSLEDVKEFVASQGRRLGAQFQGVCLKTRDGKRYKLRTNEYDEARHLRGNQAKRSYLWLERWSESRLGQYLRLYPEEACDAETVVGQFKDATQELHRLYLQIYRQKALPLGQAPQKYRKLLWDLHQTGGGAYFPNVREFMNKQETARKLWVVNYEVRFNSVKTADDSVTPQVETPA
jgi:hypothetical protein